MARWLEASGIKEGPIFRGIDRHGHVQAERLHPCSVARIVKRCAERAGLDPDKFAGHSLRAGFATTAAKRGKSLDAIMRQTLHRSERVARSYILCASWHVDHVEFIVGDSGPGIAKDALPHVFERFWQATTGSHGGLGLGLYICKTIVEAHGGQIGVESADGGGARFRFTLPAGT